tara:strand:- start:180 stop:845 length:666 start_codon:yes stop_codon:yes gene_type:complete
MYLAQSTRKDSSGEGLIGLIDGAQAIVMTLLVIEMPILIIELVEHVKNSEELFFNLTMDIFGYFLAALIIYDIWSIQKSLFQSTKSSASQNLSCISTLWLTTLIPPMLYIAEHFAQSSIKDSLVHEILNGNEVLLFRTITIFVVLVIHSILFFFSKKGDNQLDSLSVDYSSRLLRLRVIALSVILPFSLAVGFIAQGGYVLIPFILFVPFIFVPVRPLRQA